MSYETILFEVSDRIATIPLNRPEVLNAASKQMQRELADAFATAEKDPEVWTLIVTATGRGFCPGADVGDIAEDGKRFVGIRGVEKDDESEVEEGIHVTLVQLAGALATTDQVACLVQHLLVRLITQGGAVGDALLSPYPLAHFHIT